MTLEQVDRYQETHREAFEKQFKAFIRIPSVSAQPEHAADIRRAADL